MNTSQSASIACAHAAMHCVGRHDRRCKHRHQELRVNAFADFLGPVQVIVVLDATGRCQEMRLDQVHSGQNLKSTMHRAGRWLLQ